MRSGCCTGSGSFSVCGRTIPRRWRWRTSRERSSATNDPVLLYSPRASCMERSINFRVDRAAAGTWIERGLAAVRASRTGTGRNLCGRSAGHVAGAARHPRSSFRVRQAGARAVGAGAHTRSPAGMAEHAAGGTLVRCTVRGSPRQRGTCRGSGRRNARARRRIRRRARSNCVSVVSRLGGRPDGPAARRLSPHSRGVRRQYPARDAGGRK